LAAHGAEFFRIAHWKYAIFIALSGKQSQKALKFNEILFIKVEKYNRKVTDFDSLGCTGKYQTSILL
jgi:hypothetical protein